MVGKRKAETDGNSQKKQIADAWVEGKTCCSCTEVKSYSCFHNSSATEDGSRNTCKDCEQKRGSLWVKLYHQQMQALRKRQSSEHMQSIHMHIEKSNERDIHDSVIAAIVIV
jgi:hypothetical protein